MTERCGWELGQELGIVDMGERYQRFNWAWMRAESEYLVPPMYSREWARCWNHYGCDGCPADADRYIAGLIRCGLPPLTDPERQEGGRP